MNVQWVVVVIEPEHDVPEGYYHGPFASFEEASAFAEQFPAPAIGCCFPMTPPTVTPQQLRDEAAWQRVLN